VRFREVGEYRDFLQSLLLIRDGKDIVLVLGVG